MQVSLLTKSFRGKSEERENKYFLCDTLSSIKLTNVSQESAAYIFMAEDREIFRIPRNFGNPLLCYTSLNPKR